MTKLAILGAGTFAVEVLDAVELSRSWGDVRFVVSDPALRESSVHAGLPVMTLDELAEEHDRVAAIAGIVSTRRRGFIERVHALRFSFATVVHPAATVSPRAVLEGGSFVAAGAIVAANSRIGPHVIVNRGANVGHDVTLEPYATLGPGVTIAGAVSVGTGAYIGVGAVVRDHLSIGEGAVVAAGAVVVKPVPAHVLVAGVPAQVVRHGVQGL